MFTKIYCQDLVLLFFLAAIIVMLIINVGFLLLFGRKLEMKLWVARLHSILKK